MKKNLKYILALLVLTGSANLMAQTAENNFKNFLQQFVPDSTAKFQHRVGAYGNIGVSDLYFKKNSYTKSKGGFGGGFGGLYELNYGPYIFDAQLGLQLYSNSMKVSEFNNSLQYKQVPYSNGQGQGTFNANYQFQNYKEKQLMGQLELALMAGVDIKNIYFLTGLKFGFPVLGNYKTQTDMTSTTSFKDESLLGGFNSLSNHGLGTTSQTNIKPTIDDKKLKLKTNVIWSIEAGYDFWMRNQSRLRVGAFFDFGMNNINNYTGNQKMTVLDQTNTEHHPLVQVAGTPGQETVKSNTLLGNDLVGNKPLHSFFFGVKLTYTYQLKKKEVPPPPMVTPTLLTFVTNKKTGTPVDTATVTYRNLATNKLGATRKTSRSAGMATTHLKEGEYSIVARRLGYITDSTTYKAVAVPQPKDGLVPNDTVRIQLQPIPVFSTQIIDIESGEPILSTVTLIDQTTGQEVKKDKLGLNNPKLTAENLDPTHQYALSINAPGYMSAMEQVENIDSLQPVYISPIRKGAKIVLHNLFFEFGKTTLLEESKPELDMVDLFLYNNKEVTVKFVGHTDNVGSEATNQALSEGRAKAVVDALIARGVDPNRLSYEGKGEKMPVATNDTEEGRQQNRRVELVVE